MKIGFALALTSLIAIVIGYGTLSPPTGDGSLPLTDKQLHFLAFFALALPLGWVRPGWALWLVILAFLYGAAIEIVQPAVGRSADIYDLLADSLGILAGVVPGQFRKRYRSEQS